MSVLYSVYEVNLYPNISTPNLYVAHVYEMSVLDYKLCCVKTQNIIV